MVLLSSSVVVALVAYANAAALPSKSLFGIKAARGLSPTCQSSILGLMSSPLSTCLNLNALLPIALSPATTPLIPPITEFNTALCAAPECSEADIESTVSELAQACSTELEGLGLDEAQVVALAQKLIPAAKKVLCLEDSTATPAATCLTTFLNTIEEALLAPEKLTKETIGKVVSLIREGNPATTPGLQKVIDLKCSECAKKAEQIIQEVFLSAPGTSGVKKVESKFKKFGARFKKFTSDTCGGPSPPVPSGTEPPTPTGTSVPEPTGPTTPGKPGDQDGDGWPDAPDVDVPSPTDGQPPSPSGSEPPSAPEPSATEPASPEPTGSEPPADGGLTRRADGALSRRSVGTAQYIFKRLLGLLW